jgi:hypothetical protein
LRAPPDAIAPRVARWIALTCGSKNAIVETRGNSRTRKGDQT